MKVTYNKLGILLFMTGALATSSAMAQQHDESRDQAPAPAMHSDPIVQKRMEVRDANRKHRERKAAARKHYREDVRQSRDERDQATQESRARAQERLDRPK